MFSLCLCVSVANRFDKFPPPGAVRAVLTCMYGYIIAGVIGLIIVCFFIGGLTQSKPGANSNRKAPGDKPVGADTPAADEPTPDKSVTADSGEIRNARKHTPPA